MESARRGRPPVPPARVLAAAEALFAQTDAPGTITMDAIAAAAGIGKGTLFRAFGSRDALLDALWIAKLAPVRDAVAGDAAPRDRAVALLAALLDFKLANRHLIHARERAPNLMESDHYRWMHGQMRNLVAQAAGRAPDTACDFAAHALLATLHIQLIEHMLAQGHTLDAIRALQAAHADAVIAGL
jgi:AcrR family transcriptional regulator